ncbi:DUF802 domain-containing protein [Pseudoxanthomonas sp.]|uniref:DUF802 domain-containing protein n=1 Tax=Pseudoxanthomonas sp. TaxID=1871049 RepID=UPI00260E5DE9|nr:DUF802 domain-containing protein [Pseudoxanthomonas sp.]WDS37767.1 MAG: DUF802 domain-containing protein [Pseudoxanthomonas sp.]
MSRNILNAAVFLAGLLAVCWIGVGYIGSNPLGAVVALVIGACYVAGALELHRYCQATATLVAAVADADAAKTSLGTWLDRLHPGLRNAVRLRVEGQRVALPAPSMTPYLVGLLVLLGMLGTLLGMMATLRGTGLALESATDLQAIRGSLAAPVKGLAFAFGTSIAGVATSAMLGLLSALCRRERLQAVQQLDARISTTLHSYSHAYQREEAFKLQQRQAELMPALVDRLQAMVATLEQQNLAANERLQASQAEFHTRTETVYTRLASSVEQSMKAGVAESAAAIYTALQPVMDSTLAGLARETAAMHQTVTHAVDQQLAGLSTGFVAATAAASESWQTALATQQHANETMAGDLRGALDAFGGSFEQRSATLVDHVATRLDATAERWSSAQAGQQQANEALATDLRDTLAAFTGAFEQRSTALVDGVATRMDATHARWSEAQADHQRVNAAQASDLREALVAFGQTFEQRSAALVDSVATRLDANADTTANAWNDALSRQQAGNDALAARNQQALDAAAATFETHAAALVGKMQQSHEALQAALEARDVQRLQAWTLSLESMTGTLRDHWEASGARVAQRQQDICDTLATTAGEITTRAQAHARDTIAEISRLVQVASEAPKAAADVVAELRQKLSDSMVRDTAMLDERSRLLATLETLLDAVNHASTEQRTAVDALVTTSADLLDRVGTRFTEHLQAETGKLGAVADQVTGSAVEVASLGDAFGAAVQSFGEANTSLVERLQGIEGALDKSLARSDEQLAYYVAQAREVIDLSMLSQKQIIEELQLLAGRQAAAGAAAA